MRLPWICCAPSASVKSKPMRLRNTISIAAMAMAVVTTFASAQAVDPMGGSSRFAAPVLLTLQQPPESIYAPPAPPREDEGVNEGGVHLDLGVRYMTDYVYRGIDFSEVAGHEDSPNYQADAKLSFDLGKLPHPYLGLFVNYYDADPVSHFQEFRPNFGFDWLIKPLTISAGYNSYIYPDRDAVSTSEVFVKIALDDSFLFKSRKPLLTPYIYGAYDVDLYNGWYFEAGVKHDFEVEDTGLMLTLIADASYVLQDSQFLLTGTNDTGFQHYDIGAIGTYSLNTLLNVSKHYGQLDLKGYLFYTDNIADHLRADNQLWGGVGVEFKY